MPYIGKAPSSGIRSRFVYTATGSQTTFTGADDNNKTLGYTDGEYVDVYLNGVLQDPADYTATSKTSVVLDSGATASDIVEIVVYDTFSVFNGTFSGDLTVDGTTLKVDSTNNRVGIGTNVPDTPLEISVAGSGATNVLKLTTTGEGTVPSIVFEGDQGGTQHVAARIRAGQEDASNGNIIFEVEDAGSLDEAVRIMSDGSVGIGTSSPNSILHLSASNDPVITLTDTGFGASADITGSNGNLRLNSQTATIFDMADSEIARFDTSGNLLVGTTDSSQFNNSGASADTGVVIADSYIDVSRVSNPMLYLNRCSTDGEMVNFSKDGSTVGSIGVVGGTPFFSNANNSTGIRIYSGGFAACNASGAFTDNTQDVGASGVRFKDLYLGGSVYLGGTGSANALDDYEEGTWTPTITGITYATADGHYIKIGNYVHLMGILVDASTTASSANAILGGMPFTVSNDNLSGTSLEGSGFFQYWNNLQIAASAVNLTPIQNDTTCNVYYVPASGVSSGGEISQLDRQYLDASNVSIRFNITYFTD